MVKGLEETGVPDLTLLVVDDSSPDGTAEEVREIGEVRKWVNLTVRSEKKGLGSAYEEGFRRAMGSFAPDIVVEMDADLQHPPEVLPRLIAAIVGGADVALASRYVPGGSVAGWGLWRRGVSRGANSLARMLLGLRVRDATSGYRAYSKRAVEKLLDTKLPAKGFEFQVGVLKVLKTDMKIVEVPFEFRPRASGESKLGLADMARFFLTVVRMSLEG